DQSPIWTSDGQRAIWTAGPVSGGNPNLFWRAADGTGTPSRLTDNPSAQFPYSAARDGSRIFLFGGTATASSFDVQAITLTEKGAGDPKQPPESLVHTSAQE